MLSSVAMTVPPSSIAARIDAVWRIAHGLAPTRLSKGAKARVEKSAGHVEALLKRDGVIYGVTTGYGDSCTTEIPPELVTELPLHLTRFHGCGLGRGGCHDRYRCRYGRQNLLPLIGFGGDIGRHDGFGDRCTAWRAGLPT